MINSLDEAYANISALSIFTQSRFILTKVWMGPSFRSFYIEEFMSDCKNVQFQKERKENDKLANISHSKSIVLY